MLNMKTGKKIVSMILVLAFVILMIPSFDLGIRAEVAEVETGLYRFQAGDVAVINQAKIEEIAAATKDDPKFANFAEHPSFVIENGVYSVTVQGPIRYNGKDVTVSIVFGTENNEGGYDGVTIDRTNENLQNDNRDNNGTNSRIGTETTGYTTLQKLYEAGKALGWSRNNSSTAYYVPTAPFLITGGAKVNTIFLGENTIKAHVNQRYITLSNTNKYDFAIETSGSASNDDIRYCGYAGVQVDSGSSLTILDNPDSTLNVYGSYQLAGINHGGNNNYTNSKPEEVNPIFSSEPYFYPTNAHYSANAGGAAIGGGAAYNTRNSKRADYTQGTPGEIIINGGTIYAVGGHLAAAIGGGFNGASTTSKIEINGGNITAIGGRFATGIGDGDSLDKTNTIRVKGQQSPSPTFTQDAKIIINGGNITAYGGTSAAAIGTTDEVSDDSKGFGEDAFSGLTIEINGGNITAQSGQAGRDGSSYNQDSVYTSAIGAGQGSNMRDNSITIYSSATISTRSYSQYAISNWGTENTIPMVNIDPEGFVYLARFASVNYERTLTLYPVYKDTLGNPVAVEAAAYTTLNGEEHDVYYGVEETTVGDSIVKALYRVKKIEKQDGTIVFEPELDGEKRVLLNDTQGETLNFSYYYDISAGKEFVVPKYYKAVALSLQAGDYVFHVPLGGSNDKSLTNDVYAHFNKHLNGTTSASINDRDNKPCYYHFTYEAVPDKIATSETPHVTLDETAFPLTSMQVIAQPSGQAMLTGSNVFSPTVLGYTVYIPNDSTSIDLSFIYKPSEDDKKACQFVFNLEELESEGRTKFTVDAQNSGTDEITFNLTGIVFSSAEEDTGSIWINKIDKSSLGNPFLTYKITVIRRPKYYIHINAISKKYDGEPVSPEIVKITEGRGDERIHTVEDHYAYGNVLAEYGTHTSVHYPIDYDPSRADGGYSANYIQTTQFNGKDVSIAYAIVPNETETALSLITRFSYMNGETEVRKRSTVNINMDEDELVFTLDESSDHVLMPSGLGGYKIETKLTKDVEVDGKVWYTWKIYVSYYEGSTTQPKREVEVLNIRMNETMVEPPATELPVQSGDGKTVHRDYATALAQAKIDAEATFEDNVWETRYSDSYFYAAGTDKTETFTMIVKHPLNPELDNRDGFVYQIVDTYKYRHHKFHYYCEASSEDKEITFTKEQLTEILSGCTYYADPTGNGIWNSDLQKLDGPPSDAGDYILIMEYVSEKYEAYSAIAFEIRKRPIKIVGVSNWITYLDEGTIKDLQDFPQPNHLKTYPMNPGLDNDTYLYGTAYFDDVVEGDVVELSPEVYAYYNEITISHNEKKITLRYDYEMVGGVQKDHQVDWLGDLAGQKDGSGNYLNDNRNYELTGVANFDSSASAETDGFSFVHVPGALAYVAKGTIFKKSYYEDGSEGDAIWRKFWPSWSEEFLKWDESESGARDDLGNYITPHLMEENIGYQSPSNASHQDYVYLRTVNANRSAIYSVDIEFDDDIVFQYAKAVWDVNTYQYVEGAQSYWGGNDGVNNAIRIINRSDEAITFTATYYKQAVLGMYLEMGFSDTYDGSGELVETISAQLAPATGAYQAMLLTGETPVPLDAAETEAKFYIIVRGRPLNKERMEVGSITLTISSVGHHDP